MVDTTEETERTSPLVKIRDQRYRMPSKLKGLNVQFENPIGEGAFGQVYRGRWNGTAVVVKRCKLRNKESIDPRAEAKILEKLNNKAKNVVKFYGCYEDGEYCYMVMEYCKEGSIYDYVKREGIMREKWVRKVAIDVNEALRQIHSNGILHRDVSPKNVLIWEFNENNLPEVKLIDFGLSKEMVKARGTTCGTPGFMVNGKNEGTNRDYYALGCLVIYMLTKRIFDDERKRRDYVKNRIHGEITSENAIEFIRLLINPKIELDYQDIVTHPFLSEPLIERLSQRSSRILTSQNREHSRTTSREPRQPSRPPSIQRDKPKSIERRSNSDLRNNLQNVPVLPEELLKKEHSKTTERKRSLSRQPSKRQAFSVPTNCPRTNSALTIDSHHPHADIEWPLKNAVMDINKNIKNKGRIIFNSQGKYVAFEFASNLNLECVVRIERVGQGNQKVEVYDPKSRSSVRLKDYANEVPKSDLKLRITIRSSQELAKVSEAQKAYKLISKAARDFGDMVVSEWVVHKTANQKYVVTEKRTGLKKKFESREDLYRAELFKTVSSFISLIIFAFKSAPSVHGYFKCTDMQWLDHLHIRNYSPVSERRFIGLDSCCCRSLLQNTDSLMMESRKIEGTDQKSAIRPFPLKMDVQQVAEFARRHGTVASTDISHDTNRHLIRAGTLSYVLVCGLSGTAVCGGSHLLTTPLDVLKCRIQVNKAKYPSLVEAFRVTVKDEGLRGMVRGWSPTAIGYGAQGFAKFGFYEAFKKMFFDNMTPENAYAYRTVIFALAAALAESIGDVLLAPFEAMKVRTQTDPLAPTAMRHCLPMIWKSEGVSGFFKGLVPLWSRQIPYTVSKFVAFEFAIDFLYRYLKLDRQTCDRNVQLSVSLVAGILAGITSAVCSHPPDVIISQLYKDPNATFGSIVRHLGFKGCWSGLGARVFMIGSIASMQLFTVDSVKVFFHLERPKAPEPPPSLLNSQL